MPSTFSTSLSLTIKPKCEDCIVAIHNFIGDGLSFNVSKSMHIERVYISSLQSVYPETLEETCYYTPKPYACCTDCSPYFNAVSTSNKNMFHIDKFGFLSIVNCSFTNIQSGISSFVSNSPYNLTIINTTISDMLLTNSLISTSGSSGSITLSNLTVSNISIPSSAISGTLIQLFDKVRVSINNLFVSNVHVTDSQAYTILNNSLSSYSFFEIDGIEFKNISGEQVELYKIDVLN